MANMDGKSRYVSSGAKIRGGCGMAGTRVGAFHVSLWHAPVLLGQIIAVSPLFGWRGHQGRSRVSRGPSSAQ